MKVAIIKYNAGNIQSVDFALRKLGIEAIITDSPEISSIYTFQFATNISCPGIPTVDYDGKTYNTIQIKSQCWLKENLDAGTIIQGNENMTDNDVIEKWCSGNDAGNCDLYGGLYSWREMMNYSMIAGARGICPPGWHIPVLEEINILNGATDSQFGIGDPEWDHFGPRGFDSGYNLKAAWSWDNNGNGSDLFGFTILAGGYRINTGGFWPPGGDASFWTSTNDGQNNVSAFSFSFWQEQVYSYTLDMNDNVEAGYGHSVRCLMND